MMDVSYSPKACDKTPGFLKSWVVRKFNTSPPDLIEVHFQAQLLDIVAILPSTVAVEELATRVLALVALPTSAMTILISLS